MKPLLHSKPAFQKSHKILVMKKSNFILDLVDVPCPSSFKTSAID